MDYDTWYLLNADALYESYMTSGAYYDMNEDAYIDDQYELYLEAFNETYEL